MSWFCGDLVVVVVVVIPVVAVVDGNAAAVVLDGTITLLSQSIACCIGWCRHLFGVSQRAEPVNTIGWDMIKFCIGCKLQAQCHRLPSNDIANNRMSACENIFTNMLPSSSVKWLFRKFNQFRVLAISSNDFGPIEVILLRLKSIICTRTRPTNVFCVIVLPKLLPLNVMTSKLCIGNAPVAPSTENTIRQLFLISKMCSSTHGLSTFASISSKSNEFNSSTCNASNPVKIPRRKWFTRKPCNFIDLNRTKSGDLKACEEMWATVKSSIVNSSIVPFPVNQNEFIVWFSKCMPSIVRRYSRHSGGAYDYLETMLNRI